MIFAAKNNGLSIRYFRTGAKRLKPEKVAKMKFNFLVIRKQTNDKFFDLVPRYHSF